MKYFSNFIQNLSRSCTYHYQSMLTRLHLFFSKGLNSGNGHNPVEKKYVSAIFFMRNPYKKIQNSSMHSSKVMKCIKKHDGRPRSNIPFKLLRSWGHKM